ncbi:ArnT family glycosyltransferase [Sulfitobacter aestuarii]|uniref:ArnT family glycosyltransferase n=1 Tax=Sulfitobacter aestuarii TaxID=2161676 RepID=A0ABW5U3Z7_9RHOB
MTQPISGLDGHTQNVTPALSGTVVFALGLFVVAVALRLTQLDGAIYYDEYYHLLAATSRSQDGSLDIYQGAYTRAPLYTIFTSWVFDLTGGPDVAMARLPNVLFGALLAVGVSIWTRCIAGPLAGWIVALCVIFWPNGIYLSQLVRFYALHGLIFFVGAIAAYDLFRPDATTARRLLMLLLSGTMMFLALQFQDSTLVGAMAIALWAALTVLLPLLLRQSRGLIFGVLAALLVLAVAGFATGMVQDSWAAYRSSPWDRDPTGYHRALRDLYPVLWPLTPVIAVFAIHDRLRPAGFCAFIAAFGLLAHSFAGVQNIRHIYYLSPFLFALWAMGLQAVLPPILRRIRNAIAGIVGNGRARALTGFVLIGVLLFAMFAQSAVMQTFKDVIGGALHREPQAQFDEVFAVLDDYDGEDRVIVVTNDMETIYHRGRFDLTYSRNWLPEMGEVEFATDPRNGRPLISTEESLGMVVQAYPSGLFLAPRSWWSDWFGYNDVIPFLAAFNQPNVEWSIEKLERMVLLRWTTDPVMQDPQLADVREKIAAE